MQNLVKSQTRLAFIQYIFQSEFFKLDQKESIEDFQKYFYDYNIAVIGAKKEYKLKFNKNFLSSKLNNILFPISSEHLLKKGKSNNG